MGFVKLKPHGEQFTKYCHSPVLFGVCVYKYLCSLPCSYKFGKKLVYINRLAELDDVLYSDQLDIPDEVKR